ncbi:MAG TPA: hypothetical protein VES38_07765 [Methylotenera sp.]|nr:hypothetical protein [Methylotenera sp.]
MVVKNFKLGAILYMLLSATVIFFIFNSDITAQAAESTRFNKLDSSISQHGNTTSSNKE